MCSLQRVRMTSTLADERRLGTLAGRRVRLSGLFAGEVTVEHARPLGQGAELSVRLDTGELDEAVLSVDDLAPLLVPDPPAPAGHPPADPEKIDLLVESTRIRLPYAYDRQFAVSLSGIRTLAHQIEAVYRKMLPQPRLRFLLADDPGAGKTIMAGLLVKELKLQEAVDRCLILVPAPLTIQWQDELLRFFGEPYPEHPLRERPATASQPLGARGPGHRLDRLRLERPREPRRQGLRQRRGQVGHRLRRGQTGERGDRAATGLGVGR